MHKTFTEDEISFIEKRDFLFLSTVDPGGHPTVSYKGGAPGFVAVRDNTLVFPCYDGNGMFLSGGNLDATAKVGLLFIDFETPRRLRIQGLARLDNGERRQAARRRLSGPGDASQHLHELPALHPQVRKGGNLEECPEGRRHGAARPVEAAGDDARCPSFSRPSFSEASGIRQPRRGAGESRRRRGLRGTVPSWRSGSSEICSGAE